MIAYCNNKIQYPMTFFCSDIIQQIAYNSFHKLTFLELTGCPQAQFLDRDKLQEIQKKFQQTEQKITKEKGDNFTCLVTSDGAFWLEEPGLDEVSQSLEEQAGRLSQGALLPTWKMTTREVLYLYYFNIKQLIIAHAYDNYRIRGMVPESMQELNLHERQHKQIHRTLAQLTGDLQDYSEPYEWCGASCIGLYERCKITTKMMENAELFEEDLGYSLQDVMSAKRILENRCKSESLQFETELSRLRAQALLSLRDCESLQLRRAGSWLHLSRVDHHFEPALDKMHDVMLYETKCLTSLVQEREEELGITFNGQNTIKYAEYCQKTKAASQQKSLGFSNPRNYAKPRERAGHRMVYASLQRR